MQKVGRLGHIRRVGRRRGLPTPLSENLYLASDVIVRVENSLYLIKPLLCRFCLVGEALRDAERIVRAAQPEARKCGA